MTRRMRLLASLVGGILCGAGVAALSPYGQFGVGWLSSTFLLWICFYAMLSAWGWVGGGRKLALMIALAFFIRLGGGIAMSLALPQYGYDNSHQNAGYVFKDSYYRDMAAWDLASSKDISLWQALGQEVATDQYGGLVSISVLVYHFLSPDAQRTFLILILCAFAYAIGVPFFWQAICQRWNEKLADLATWVLILYPEGIFFSVSQMREPFLIGGGAVLFWSVLHWSISRRASIIAAVTSMAVMLLISWRVAILIAFFAAVWFWLEYFTAERFARARKSKWAIPVLVVLAVIILASSLTWLRSSMWWGFRMTETNSARLVLEMERLGTLFRTPMIIGFGLTQVVLPAAIAQPAIALWRGITIFRAAGWYTLAPFLVYAFVTVLQIKATRERRIILWLSAACLAWAVIASARAGGDLWDNPRYRTIFLPWLAFIASYTFMWARQQGDPWLTRLLLMEAIFLLFFTQWYMVRYHVGTIWVRLPFWTMVGWIVGLSVLIAIGGLAWDHWGSNYFRRKNL